MQLKSGTLLKGGAYVIEKVLGQGGFGITYLAEQAGLNRKVAVKEFFMKELCNRDKDTSYVSVPSEGSRDQVGRFRMKFIKEAQTIAKMENHHIITIFDVFEENGTAYYVMEYLSCGSLAERIPSGGLPESEAVGYIRQVADALSCIHENKILHLDIKPSNILFRKADEAVLIDFGISKHYDEVGGSQTSSTPVGISEGYAPTEQYEREGISSFSASIDIYSLGATLYCLLSGHRPPKASIVLNDGLPPLPSSVSASTRVAVETAMSPKRKDRPQSVEDFLELLDTPVVTVSDEETVVVDSSSEESDGSSSGNSETSDSLSGSKSKGLSRGVKWFCGLAVGLVSLAVLYFVINRRPDIPDHKEDIVAVDTSIVEHQEIPASVENNSARITPSVPVQEVSEPVKPSDPFASEWESDYNTYSSLIEMGDEYSKNDATLSQAKSKYEQAAAYERKYKGTRYSDKFSKRASSSLKSVESRIAEKEAAAKAEAERLAREEAAREEARRQKEEAERKRNEASYSNGILRVKGIEYPMVYVSGGSFDMGATSEQGSDAYSDEKPVHRVTLSSYSIGKYEVTQELWEAVMGSNPSKYKGSRRPVEKVSWNDCQEFIRKLNDLTGASLRLPTEAEWEFAARGGNSSRGYKYSGSDRIGDAAWYYDNSGSETHAVGGKSANELGLYDMSGNVWEWCSDCYGAYSSSSQTNPKGPGSGSNRVIRGGCWINNAGYCRVSNRDNDTPDDRFSFVGLRLCH